MTVGILVGRPLVEIIGNPYISGFIVLIAIAWIIFIFRADFAHYPLPTIIVVKYKAGTPITRIRAISRSLGLSTEHLSEDGGTTFGYSVPERDIPKLLGELATIPEVEGAEQEFIGPMPHF